MLVLVSNNTESIFPVCIPTTAAVIRVVRAVDTIATILILLLLLVPLPVPVADLEDVLESLGCALLQGHSLVGVLLLSQRLGVVKLFLLVQAQLPDLLFVSLVYLFKRTEVLSLFRGRYTFTEALNAIENIQTGFTGQLKTGGAVFTLRHHQLLITSVMLSIRILKLTLLFLLFYRVQEE